MHAGLALMAIRDKRLYREQYATFETYCRERWGMGRNYVNKQIAAAGVIENVGTIVPTMPANEAQVRWPGTLIRCIAGCEASRYRHALGMQDVMGITVDRVAF